MKRNITTALFCALTFGVTQAQDIVIQNVNDISVIPGTITANNKPVFASCEEDNGVETIKIYDENFNVSKSISHSIISGTTMQWNEITTVAMTGLQQSSIYTRVSDRNIDLSDVKTSVQLASALNQSEYNGENVYIGFTDSEGFPSCYNSHGDSYAYPEYFGHDYLQTYCRLQNGILYEVRIDYMATYDEESAADWVQSGSINESSFSYGLCSFWIEDHDGKFYSDNGIYCSQTLFNDDSSWEIVVPVLEECVEISSTREQDIRDGEVTLSRTCYKRDRIIGLKVLNENGAEIMTLELPGYGSLGTEMNIIRVNGKSYLRVNDYSNYNIHLYSIEKSGNSVKLNEVARRRLTNVGDGIIDVNTDGESGQVLLTNMAGSTVDRKTARGETVVRLNTRHLAKGVYNVTLQRDGRTVANEKVLVK